MKYKKSLKSCSLIIALLHAPYLIAGECMDKHMQSFRPDVADTKAFFKCLEDRIDAKGARGEKGEGVEPGTIAAFGGTIVPDGWLVCDGREFDDDEVFSLNGSGKLNGDFSALRAAIGTTWGGTVDKPWLPDLRGYFLRGVDDRPLNSTGVDPERPRMVGAEQLDALQKHEHKVAIGYGGVKSGRFPNGGGWGGNQGDPYRAMGKTELDGGEEESRPRNKSVHFIIKY